MPRPPAARDPDAFTYDPELAPGYFVQVRSDFLRSPAFTPIAKVLYEVLLTYAAEKTTAWPGQARLAHECAVSEPTIRKALRELEAAALVTHKRLGLNQTNRYHLHKLATLPPHAGTQKSFVPKRKKLTPQNASRLRPRSQDSTDKVESVQIESAEIEGRDYHNDLLRRHLEAGNYGIPPALAED